MGGTARQLFWVTGTRPFNSQAKIKLSSSLAPKSWEKHSEDHITNEFVLRGCKVGRHLGDVCVESVGCQLAANGFGVERH
jgi:hypothetical protein